ncbi:MAG: 6,7-dimethyl-8-ribityllumazine synthase [Bdellovibrionales bacterium]|nr:6,7-dimethyl-8-ribityllumazine synthase [Bdellovibrionales bacterium]
MIEGEKLYKSKCSIGIVTARFNFEVTQKLEAGAHSKLQEMGVTPDSIHLVRVPGSYEIPLAAKWLLASGCDGVVALGAVIRGDTSHYDYVCQSVERGCTTLQLETGCPVVFGVLTTENEEQAHARAGGSMGNKGSEASEVLMEMLNLKQRLKTQNKEFNK